MEWLQISADLQPILFVTDINNWYFNSIMKNSKGLYLLLLLLLLLTPFAWSQKKTSPIDVSLTQIKAAYAIDPQKGISLAKQLYAFAVREHLKTAELDILRQLTYFYWDIPDYRNARLFAQKAVMAASAAGVDSLTGDFLVLTGAIDYINSNYSTAIDNYREALTYYKKDKLETRMANTYLNIGICEMKLCRFEPANEYFLQSARIFDRLKDLRDLSAVYNSMGTCFLSLNDPAKSLEYNRKAFAVRLELKDSLLLAQSMNNIGEAFRNQQQYDSALFYLFRCMDMRANVKDSGILVLTLQNIGATFRQTGNPQKAVPFILRSLNIAAVYDMKEAIARGQLDLANAYMDEKKYQPALAAVKTAVNIASDLKTPELLMNAAGTYHDIYQATGDYKNALIWYQRENTLKDSLFTAAKSKAISELEIKYQTSQKEKDIASLHARNYLQQKIVRQQQVSIVALVICALLLLLLCGFAYYHYRIKNKANQRIQTLMRDLHHRVKNNLQMLAGLFSMQISELKDENTRNTLRENETRLVSMNLIHNRLYQNESDTQIAMNEYLTKLLEHLRDAFAGDKAALIQLRIQVDPVEVEADIAVAIGLIVNELVTNSLKYAFDEKGGEVFLTLQQQDKSQLVLSIGDNGRGMPAHNKEKKSSFGLKLVHLLTRQLHTTLLVNNDQGTFYQMNIPLK